MSGAQPLHYPLIIAHKPAVCLVLRTGASFGEDVTAQQIRANRKTLVEIYLNCLLIAHLYCKSRVCVLIIGGCQDGRDDQSYHQQDKRKQLASPFFWSLALS